MATAKKYSVDGKPVGDLTLSDALFAADGKPYSLHQNVKTYLANQRQGTHDTLGRSEVSGGGAKPWKQKGTGRARSGSNTSPLWPGGGITFGPQPRDYTMKLQKKVKRQAIKTALSTKAADGKILIVDQPKFDKPQTKIVARLLDEMKIAGTKVLLLVSGVDKNFEMSCRNIQGLTYKRAALASAYDLVHAEYLVMTPAGLKECEEVFTK